jgi:hypothetical protein
MTEDQAALVEIGVLRDDGVTVLFGERLDQCVGSLREPALFDVR